MKNFKQQTFCRALQSDRMNPLRLVGLKKPFQFPFYCEISVELAKTLCAILLNIKQLTSYIKNIQPCHWNTIWHRLFVIKNKITLSPQPPKGLITNSLVEIAIKTKAKLTFETKWTRSIWTIRDLVITKNSHNQVPLFIKSPANTAVCRRYWPIYAFCSFALNSYSAGSDRRRLY